jgi:hypothetical protein
MALAIVAFTVVTALGVSSSKALLDLVLGSNSSAGQVIFSRYWFCFRGIAFEPVTYHFARGVTCSVGVMVIGISFLSWLFLQC